MKRMIVLLALFLPLFGYAQAKLTNGAMEDFSTRAAERYPVKADTIMEFITEQMSRSGAGGLEIDKTMTTLGKDPVALDAALKYLYQFSDCNRQRLIGNLRTLGIKSGNVFPMATYIENKYKGDSKALLEEKPEIVTALREGRSVAAEQRSMAPTVAIEETTTATDNNTATSATTTATTTSPSESTTTAAPVADTRNWEVREVFRLTEPEQLAGLYGKDNVIMRNATDREGNELGRAYVVYPDTDNEMQIIFHADKSKTVTFAQSHSRWKSPFGIKAGDPLEKVIKVNGRNFKINGFEWENGGTVDSWEGGALQDKGVTLIFKVNNTGDPKLYDQVTGGKKIRTDLPVLKKLDVIVEEVSFKTQGE